MRVSNDSSDSQPLACFDDSHSDFTSVGNQYFVEASHNPQLPRAETRALNHR